MNTISKDFILQLYTPKSIHAEKSIEIKLIANSKNEMIQMNIADLDSNSSSLCPVLIITHRFLMNNQITPINASVSTHNFYSNIQFGKRLDENTSKTFLYNNKIKESEIRHCIVLEKYFTVFAQELYILTLQYSQQKLSINDFISYLLQNYYPKNFQLKMIDQFSITFSPKQNKESNEQIMK